MSDYDQIYRDGTAPWEIGTIQPALAEIVAGPVGGPRVLDLGCGTGELALALARRGLRVTGVDISPVAIDHARAKAAAEGLSVDFLVRDATALSPEPFDALFDALFDSGLLHNLRRHGGLQEYLALLPRLAAPGATLVVLAISEAAGHGWGLTADHLRESFAGPAWTDTDVTAASIVAHTAEGPLILPAFLLRTVRTLPSVP